MSLDPGSRQYLSEVLGLHWIQWNFEQESLQEESSAAKPEAASSSLSLDVNEKSLSSIVQAFQRAPSKSGTLVLSPKTDEMTRALLNRILLSIGMTLQDVVWVEVVDPATVTWQELEALNNLRALLAFGNFQALREAPHIVFRRNQVTSLITHELDLLSHHQEAKRQTWEALKTFQATLNGSY